MTDQQELSCPNCGARIYATDAQCVSCGVRLDEGPPVDEPRHEAPPAAAMPETQGGLKAALLIVWPVYLVAGVIGVASLGIALPNFSSLSGLRGFFVFFGLLTAYGLFRLRTWAWWCALIWTVVVAVTVTLAMLLGALLSVMWGGGESGHSPSGWLAIAMAPGCALVVLLVWPLVARRRLFF